MNNMLKLEERNKLFIDGVTEVQFFDENTVSLVTELGILCIEGRELSVTTLLIEQGKVDICGKIDGMFYTEKDQVKKKTSFWSR